MSLTHTRGMILISVMIYLIILSVLALSALEASALQTRMSNNIKDSNRLFVCADATLQQVQNLLVKGAVQKCLIAEQASDYYRNKNASWWQSYACKIKVCNDYKTLYLIEALAEEPCFKIGNYPVGTRYYRISARASYNNDNYQTVLQSTVLIPFTSSKICPSSKIKVHPGGKQSWRQIY